MIQPSSYRRLVAAAAASSLALGATMIAPTIAGASVHGHRAKSRGVEVRLEKSKKYGSVLVDGAGQSLYFLAGRGGKPLACKTGCAAIWPPLLTTGKPRAAKGVDAKMLGTVKRGSSLQVTYDGRPLYRFAGDTAAGQVKGERIQNFGGTWYLLGASGAPVHAALTSAHSSGKATKGNTSKATKGKTSKATKASSSGSGKSSGGW